MPWEHCHPSLINEFWTWYSNHYTDSWAPFIIVKNKQKKKTIKTTSCNVWKSSSVINPQSAIYRQEAMTGGSHKWAVDCTAMSSLTPAGEKGGSALTSIAQERVRLENGLYLHGASFTKQNPTDKTWLFRVLREQQTCPDHYCFLWEGSKISIRHLPTFSVPPQDRESQV